MSTNRAAARWRKSSRSIGNAGECVEVAHALRDSKNPTGPVLSVPVEALLTAVKRDRLS
jgi:hypothetical protein